MNAMRVYWIAVFAASISGLAAKDKAFQELRVHVKGRGGFAVTAPCFQ